ncbi:unnamed protein product [Trichobilharzia regenti]|nr:unnamed protein product [Trichobilharzia regenti]
MATMHHCSIRSCLLVERALVRLLNTVCAILSAQFKSETVQNAVIHNNSGGNNNKDSNSIPAPARCADGLLLFRRMCMGVVDLSRIATDLNTNNNSSTKNLLNINLERCNSNPGLLSLKPMESIDWAMCLESSKLDTNSEFTASFTYDYDESHSSYRNDNIGLPTIDSICDLLAPYLFRDGDLGWQARDSLLLIAAYSLRDEEFSHSIAKYSSICAVSFHYYYRFSCIDYDQRGLVTNSSKFFAKRKNLCRSFFNNEVISISMNIFFLVFKD